MKHDGEMTASSKDSHVAEKVRTKNMPETIGMASRSFRFCN